MTLQQLHKPSPFKQPQIPRCTSPTLLCACTTYAMTSQRMYVWGIVSNQLYTGQQCPDANTATLLQAGGWSPALPPHHTAPQQLTPAGMPVQQLVVGWRHAVLLSVNGQAYRHPSFCWAVLEPAHAAACSKDLDGQGSCINMGTGDPHHQQQQQQPNKVLQADSRGWQLLQLQLPNELPLPGLHPPRPSPGAQQQVVQVSAGDQHCLLLTATGTVWACGGNTCGQLGCAVQQQQHQDHQQQEQQQLGQQQQQEQQQQQQQQQPTFVSAAAMCSQPVPVLGPDASDCVCQEPIAQVAAGSCHSAALTASQGQLYCWGWNGHGQCCTGGTDNVPLPELCTALDGVPLAAVAAGMAHTVCVSRDGAVYACGWNSNGQLGTGQGHRQQQRQQLQQPPEQLSASAVVPQLVEAPQLDQEHVVQVACGSRHTLVLACSGAVWAWGWNKYRQCCCTAGDEASAEGSDVLQPQQVQLGQPGKAVAVHAGRWHSCITVEVV